MNPEHHPKLNPVRAFQALHPNENEAEISLSEYYDCEPNLEFDDSELQNTAPVPPEFFDLPPDDLLTAADGTIEENFEEELASAPSVYYEIVDSSLGDNYEDLMGTGLVEVVGDDTQGRRIIVISACHLLPRKDLDADRLLKYLMFTLDRYVEQDYSLVYFHHGLTSQNKPPLLWLWKAYKAFDRKYKKNLKALYLVHPTNFIRVVWQMLRPAISVKFGRKMMYVNSLQELGQHLPLSMLSIPRPVLEMDAQLMAGDKRSARGRGAAAVAAPRVLPPVTTQFGVSLQFIRDYNPNIVDAIPPIIRICVEFLSQPDAIETEGIFRRSANNTVIRNLIQSCNAGERIDFKGDAHAAAVLMKTFLKDLEEPILTFELYDEIMSFPTWKHTDRPRNTKILLLEKLPLENYKLLKYIIKFLWKVQDRSCLNKMTINNLAVVFGPNFIWGQDHKITLQTIGPVNTFADYILANQESIFII